MSLPRIPVVVVTTPGRTPRVMVGTDRRACARAIERMIATWGRERTTADFARGAIVAVDGSAAYLTEATVLDRPARYAVISQVGADPREIFLVGSQMSAKFVASHAEANERITTVEIKRGAGPSLSARPAAPEPMLVGLLRSLPDDWALHDPFPTGSTFCPRCEDVLLHLDPALDARAKRDGARICRACGVLEDLRSR